MSDAPVRGAGVCVVGALNLDLIARTPRLPRPGETVLSSTLTRHPGGKGLNQAVAAARAGASVRMIGRVGADEAGEVLTDYLRRAEVDVRHLQRDGTAATGHAMITVSDAGENTIVVIAGANLALALPPAEAVTGAGVLLAQLETAVAPVAELFARAAAGCLKVLNAAPALPQGVDLFPLCDLLVLNETELAAYTGVAPPPDDLDAITAAVGRLSLRPQQHAVVTLGAAGVLSIGPGGRIHVPGRRVQAVDTVGAGDCFCGVLAAGLGEGLALDVAMCRANAAAAIAVTRLGAAEAMPTREEIVSAVAP